MLLINLLFKTWARSSYAKPLATELSDATRAASTGIAPTRHPNRSRSPASCCSEGGGATAGSGRLCLLLLTSCPCSPGDSGFFFRGRAIFGVLQIVVFDSERDSGLTLAVQHCRPQAIEYAILTVLSPRGLVCAQGRQIPELSLEIDLGFWFVFCHLPCGPPDSWPRRFHCEWTGCRE